MPQRPRRSAVAVIAAAAAVIAAFSPAAAGAGIAEGPLPSASSPALIPPDATVSPPAAVRVTAPRFEQVAQVEGGEVDVSDRALIAAVQRALQAVGFDPGPVDGIVGPRTRSAVRAYQRTSNLPEDGRITKALLADLAKEVTENR